MVFPYKSRNSCENNVLHTIFTSTAFKNRICKFLKYNGPKLRKYENSEKSRTDGAFMGKQCL